MEEYVRHEGYLYKSTGDNIIEAYKILDDSDNDSSDHDDSDSVEHESHWAGKIEVADEGDGIWLDHIEVKPEHRRRGIAAKLIELAMEYFDLSHIPAVKECEAYQFCLTAEGEKLIAGCLKKGIITPGMCYFSTLSEQQSSRTILEDGEDDPGYDSGMILHFMPIVKTSNNSGSNNSDEFSGMDISEDNQEPLSKSKRTNRQIHNALLKFGHFSNNQERKDSYRDACTLSRTDYQLKWQYGFTDETSVTYAEPSELDFIYQPRSPTFK